MVLVTLSDKYPVDNIKLQVDDPALNFSKAKDLAKEKARERCNVGLAGHTSVYKLTWQLN